jgi:hypothetical protein
MIRSCKSLIFEKYKTRFLEELFTRTSTYTRPNDDPYEDPLELKKISLNRHKAAKSKQQSSLDVRFKNSLFHQAFSSLNNLPHFELRRSFVHMLDDGQQRTFKVKFHGEGVQDNGGPYRECFNDFMAELFSEDAIIPLFIKCPNNRNGQGLNQDKFIPNAVFANLEYYEFVGKLIGIALRHKIPLGMSLPLSFWKYLLSEKLEFHDLECIDISTAKYLSEVLSFNDSAETFADLYECDFTCILGDGISSKELVLNGKKIALNLSNRKQWVNLVLQERLFESKKQMDSILKGLKAVIPLASIALLTPSELEQAVCGTPGFDVDLLKSVTVYEGKVSENDPHIEYFWNVLREFTPLEKSEFLRFAWARSRLPATASEFKTKFKLQEPRVQTLQNPDLHLPQSHTCFFSLTLPAYSSQSILREKLLYASRNCATMDLDMKLQDDELYNYEAKDV